MSYCPHGQYPNQGYIVPHQISTYNRPAMISSSHMHHYQHQYQNQQCQSQHYQTQHYHHPPQSYPQDPRASSSVAKPSRGAKLHEVGSLTPGMQHQLSSNPLPTPQSILDGTFGAAVAHADTNRDVVTYVPRRPEYFGEPSLPSIVFSVQGRPGPFLPDIIEGSVMLDGAYDLVFRERVWKQTSLTVDWPGVTSSSGYIPCIRDNRDLTRTEVATIVAEKVIAIVSTGLSGKSLKWGPQVIDANTKPWNLRKIDYRDVRLISINYYRKTWIPVLAVNA